MLLHLAFEAHLHTAEVLKKLFPHGRPKPGKKGRPPSVETAASDLPSDGNGSVLGSHFAHVPISAPIDPDQKLTGQRTLTVARYGRIYKRKMPSKWLGFIPPTCPPGFRFCRDCNCAQPMSAFYTNVKRYVCKRHHYERVNIRFKVRMAPAHAAPERNAEQAWHALNILAKGLGYKKLCYDRHDIMDLIRNTDIPLCVHPRAVPIDPRKPMRPRNVAIVRRVDFDMLFAVYDVACSQTVYTRMVHAFNLLPPNADAGTPWDPFHDPSYIRQDCDIAEILHEESQRTPDRPAFDAVMAIRAELAAKKAEATPSGSSSADTPDSSSSKSQTTHPADQPEGQAASC